MPRIKAEIDWMAENKIEYVSVCDSNWGILERDLEITEYVIKKKHIGNNKKDLSLTVSLLCLILYKPRAVNNIISKVIGLVNISKPYISIAW